MTKKTKKTKICLDVNLDLPLSLKKLDDYLRLAQWLFWDPHSLKRYLKRHVHGKDNRRRQDIALMAGGVTLFSAACLLYLGLLVIGALVASGALQPPSLGNWLSALCLSILAGMFVLLPLVLYKVLDVPGFVVAPTLYAFCVVIGLGYLHWQLQPRLQYRNLVLVYMVMGMFSGLMYSQIAAYRNYGLTYTRLVVATSILYGFMAAAVQVIARVVMPISNEYFSYYVDLLVAAIACIAGYLLVAPRFDDWLYAWVKTRTRGGECVFPPRVAYMEFPYLQQTLEQAATKDWCETVTSAAHLWDGTTQHRLIAATIYRLLNNALPDQLDERLAVVTHSGRPWQEPIWFANGGERTTRQLLVDLTREHAWSDLLGDTGTTDPRDRYFYIVQVCRAAPTINKAREEVGKLKPGSGDETMRDLLDALHELKGEGSFTGRRIINSTLLPKTGVPPAKQINSGAWKAVDNMLRIYYYIWLSVRCTLADHRDEGATYVRSQLALHRQRIRGDLSIDVGVKKFFAEIDGKWLNDIDSMIDRSKPFDPEPFNSDRMVNHFEYDEPVRELRKLVGRKSQIRELSEAWSGSHLQVVEITAPVLCGSTSLFLAVANSIKPGNGAAHLPDGKAVAHVCIGHLTSNTQAMSQVANGLYDELRPYLIDPPRKSKLNEEPIRVLGFMIRKICEERILIMGFDDVDRLERVVREREDLRRFMRFIFHLSEILPQFGIALIGALDRADAYQELRAQTTRFAKPIQLGAIGNNDRRGTIEKLLNGPIDDFPLRFTPSAITEIIKLSGGVPYLTQLIAWNTYERVLANGASDPDVTREETFCWDPLITKDAVKEVLKLSTFRVGWEYYVRRLEEHFENDWSIVRSILGQYSSDPELGHDASDFDPPRTSRKRSKEESLVPIVLDRLMNHRVLEEDPDTGLYYLRVGLMNPELLKQLNELTNTSAT